MILYKYSANSKHLSICASNPVVPWVREEESLSGSLRKVGGLPVDWFLWRLRLSLPLPPQLCPILSSPKTVLPRLFWWLFLPWCSHLRCFCSFHVITAPYSGFLFFPSPHSLGNYFDYSRGKFASAIPRVIMEVINDRSSILRGPSAGLLSPCPSWKGTISGSHFCSLMYPHYRTNRLGTQWIFVEQNECMKLKGHTGALLACHSAKSSLDFFSGDTWLIGS